MGMPLDKIKYLSFEGGGGKGNAYAGAILALQHLKVLQFYNNSLVGQIKEISGSSAGAITALLLGSGYSFTEIMAELTKGTFINFFDAPVVGEQIYAGRGFSYIDIDKLNNRQRSVDDTFRSSYIVIVNLLWYKLLKEVDKQNHGLSLILDANRFKLQQCLLLDYGLFSGKVIHIYFNNLISKKVFLKKNCLDPNSKKAIARAEAFAEQEAIKSHLWTFQEHYDIFKVMLRFVSVNLSTENVQVFSKEKTPNFPVATAARMSMSLPFVFKPVTIFPPDLNKLGLDSYWAGIWVDGGVFDNAPVRIFKDDESSLLLRLGNRRANHLFFTLETFVKTYLLVGILGSGSGQVTETTFPIENIIQLDIRGTDLLKFDLEVNQFKELAQINVDCVYKYFNAQSFKIQDSDLPRLID